MPPLGGEPIRISRWSPANTRGMELPYGENCMILTATVFDWSTHLTDRQMDGEAIAYSAVTIYAICCRALIETGAERTVWNCKSVTLLPSLGWHMKTDVLMGMVCGDSLCRRWQWRGRWQLIWGLDCLPSLLMTAAQCLAAVLITISLPPLTLLLTTCGLGSVVFAVFTAHRICIISVAV